MILIDVNLLLYAVNRDLQYGTRAREWLESTLSGGASVGLPWVVILAFVRLTTSNRVFERPLTTEVALAFVEGWLRLPTVRAVSPGPGHWQILQNLLAASGSAGNLTTDAHIAALALEHGYAVYSSDNDFKRFAGIRHINPLA